MSDDNHEFTTESSPGEQAFESTIDDAVGFFKEAFATDWNGYGSRMRGVLRSCVRAAFTSEGRATPEAVAWAARTRSEQNDFTPEEPNEPQ